MKDYEFDEWLVGEAVRSPTDIHGEIVSTKVTKVGTAHEVRTTYADGHEGFAIFGPKAWEAFKEMSKMNKPGNLKGE